MEEKKIHFGAWLKGKIADSKMPFGVFARKIDVNERTLYRWFKQAYPDIRDSNLAAIAQSLGYKRSHVESILIEAMRDDPVVRERWKKQAEMLEGANTFEQQAAAIEQMKKQGLWDKSEEEDFKMLHNVACEGFVDPVPTFDAAVAAGPWTEVGEVAELHDSRLIENGVFRIKIKGDSMEPNYHEGNLIEFKIMRDGGPISEGDVLLVGKDYYVQVGDEATFKRLSKIDDEELVFQAINRKKYPKPIMVRRAQILRMAKACFKLDNVG